MFNEIQPISTNRQIRELQDYLEQDMRDRLGISAEQDDGVTLTSCAHPVAPWYRQVVFWLLLPYHTWRLSRAVETFEISKRGWR